MENSAVAETNLEIGTRNAVFARAELVRKSAEELVLPGVDPEREFDVASLAGGYVREIGSIGGGSLGVGGRASVNFVPAGLAPFYGTRRPAGIDVYVRLRPKRMNSGAMPAAERGMPRMEHGGHRMPMASPGDTAPSMPAMPGMKPGPDSSRGTPHDSTMRDMPTSSVPSVTKIERAGEQSTRTADAGRVAAASAQPGTRSRIRARRPGIGTNPQRRASE